MKEKLRMTRKCEFKPLQHANYAYQYGKYGKCLEL